MLEEMTYDLCLPICKMVLFYHHLPWAFYRNSYRTTARDQHLRPCDSPCAKLDLQNAASLANKNPSPAIARDWFREGVPYEVPVSYSWARVALKSETHRQTLNDNFGSDLVNHLWKSCVFIYGRCAIRRL